MNPWQATDITTPSGEPDLLVMSGPDNKTRLVLAGNGFEASLSMDATTLRHLRDELTDRLEALKEAA